MTLFATPLATPPARGSAAPGWVALLGLLGCAREPSGPPNVVLAVLDTVRADHVSCYGYRRATTPAIDALAEVGDRYRVARSTSSWTLPSHASMFTGLYPFHHGADARQDPATKLVQDSVPLGPDAATLAEALAGEGYQTAAVVANGGYLGKRFGLDQGFDEYSEKTGSDPRRGPDVNQKAIEILERRDPARPFFLFVNYMDAHRPYNVDPLPPERAAALPAPDPEKPMRLLDELVMAVLDEDDPPEPELIARVVTHYDYGVAHGDLAIGELVAWLRAAGEWDDTLFIVTADHGEYFSEHDLVEHSKDIYEEGLRVPLVVHRPGQRRGRVIEEPISLVEIPCVVQAELPRAAAERLAGTFPCGAGGEQSFAELRYTRLKDLKADYGDRFRRERTAIYREGHKLIRSTDGHHELYDLEVDPLEAHNLFRPGDALSERLLAEVSRVREEADRGRRVFAPPAEPSAQEQEELRKLGYVDGEPEQPAGGE